MARELDTPIGYNMGVIKSSANALRSATTRVDVSAATAPSSGQVLTATGTTAATWQTPTGGSFAVTAGVSAGPASSSTQTITHGLGRTPIIIRIEGVGKGANSSNGVTTPRSTGIWCSSGSKSVVSNYGPGSQNPGSSSTNTVILEDGSAPTSANGVVGNVGATTFDIVWTASGSTANCTFMWEAQ